MTACNDAAIDEPFLWRGIVDPELVHDDVVLASHELSDAARVGDWSSVFDLLDDPELGLDINWWVPGGRTWFTVLHQAAWHGAPNDVAAELVQRGALRALIDARGRTAHDVRVQRDLRADDPKEAAAQHHKSLILRTRYLKPPPSPLTPSVVRALNWHLGEVIDSRIRGRLYGGSDPRRLLRYPPVGVLHEIPNQHLWFPVPGMYGGFDIRLVKDVLEVKSWCRLVVGSGRAHLVTPEGAVLVDSGFADDEAR